MTNGTARHRAVRAADEPPPGRFVPEASTSRGGGRRHERAFEPCSCFPPDDASADGKGDGKGIASTHAPKKGAARSLQPDHSQAPTPSRSHKAHAPALVTRRTRRLFATATPPRRPLLLTWPAPCYPLRRVVVVELGRGPRGRCRSNGRGRGGRRRCLSPPHPTMHGAQQAASAPRCAAEVHPLPPRTTHGAPPQVASPPPCAAPPGRPAVRRPRLLQARSSLPLSGTGTTAAPSLPRAKTPARTAATHTPCRASRRLEPRSGTGQTGAPRSRPRATRQPTAATRTARRVSACRGRRHCAWTCGTGPTAARRRPSRQTSPPTAQARPTPRRTAPSRAPARHRPACGRGRPTRPRPRATGPCTAEAEPCRASGPPRPRSGTGATGESGRPTRRRPRARSRSWARPSFRATRVRAQRDQPQSQPLSPTHAVAAPQS